MSKIQIRITGTTFKDKAMDKPEPLELETGSWDEFFKIAKVILQSGYFLESNILFMDYGGDIKRY
jgi:hypothetical protein